MQMNPSIILAGQTPDIAGSAMRGVQLAQGVNDTRQTNALRNLYQTQGAGILAGDQNALNALAGFDPAAALGIQGARQGMEFSANAENRAAQKFQMELDAMSQAEAAEAADRLRGAIGKAAAMQTPEQWDTYVTSIGKPELAGQFQNREAVLLQYMGLTEYIEAQKGLKELRAGDAPNVPSGVQTLQWRAEQAGFVPGTPEYKAFMANGGNPPSGMSLEVMPDGTVRFAEGGENKQIASGTFTSPDAMIASIDGILNDSALDLATGWLAWTQNIPGTESRRFGARAKQLEGQAFLQAFESLKGAGQITEIEGIKATQAIGRLDTAQRPEDYRAALEELREILSIAKGRPVGWATQGGGQDAGVASDAAATPQQIATMGSDQILTLDTSNLSVDQQRALDARLKELGY